MDDWRELKSSILKKKERQEWEVEIPEQKGEFIDFIFNKTDVAIIRTLLAKGTRSLKELRKDSKRSRVSVYLSLKKLKKLSLVEENDSNVEFKKCPLADALYHLLQEGFDFEVLMGERALVMQSLLEWKTIDQIAVERNMSLPSIYKYLKELKSYLEQEGGSYRLKENNLSLISFLRLLKLHRENELERFQIWSSCHGTLFKSTNKIDGVLTAFSRFREFKVDYSPEYFYYFVPEKKLSLEEIFVHSLRCAEDDNLLPMISEFFIKNEKRLDVFEIDSLAVHFDVGDAWFDIQARILKSAEMRSKKLPEAYYLSPENSFFTSSLSSECGEILKCEEILLRENLSWDMLFPQYAILKRDPDFRWQALLSRLQILEQRTGVKIPFLKRLSQIYIENAILFELEKPKTVDDLKGSFSIPEYQIRNILSRMVKKGRLNKLGGRPIKFALD